MRTPTHFLVLKETDGCVMYDGKIGDRYEAVCPCSIVGGTIVLYRHPCRSGSVLTQADRCPTCRKVLA